MASDQSNRGIEGESSHPTQTTRRKVKGPLSTVFSPLLPEAIARYHLDTSSEDLAEDKEAEHDAKQQRSTSSTPLRLGTP